MDTIGSFDKMELIVLYNPEDSKKDKTECVIKKFVRLPKQQILQLRWVVIPSLEASDSVTVTLIPPRISSKIRGFLS